MDINAFLMNDSNILMTPFTFALLVGLAAAFIWRAFTPSTRVQMVHRRLDGYVDEPDMIEQEDTPKPFSERVFLPLLRRVLSTLGRWVPNRAMEATRQTLIHAGEPGGLTVLDFYGLRLLAAVLMGGGWFLLASMRVAFGIALFSSSLLVGVGFFVPMVWLRGRVERRKTEIARSLPNALDMLTIGVEAGLAFESAMLQVAEQWDNALTTEFRRTVLDMRVGTPLDVALQRLVERTAVDDLRTLVAILIQSTRLGVAIARVLHNQAAGMRQKRRQRAEELARQASVKMAFPLVFFIFPAMFVVILGPALPGILGMFGS